MTLETCVSSEAVSANLVGLLKVMANAGVEYMTTQVSNPVSPETSGEVSRHSCRHLNFGVNAGKTTSPLAKTSEP